MAQVALKTAVTMIPYVLEAAQNENVQKTVKSVAKKAFSMITSPEAKKALSSMLKRSGKGGLRDRGARRGFAGVKDRNAQCDLRNRIRIESAKRRIIEILLMSTELKMDEYHVNMAKLIYKEGEYEESDKNFWHLVYYCASRVAVGINGACSICEALDFEPTMNRYIDYISINKEKIICLMVGYYSIPYSDIWLTATLLKRCYNSKSGTRVYDLLLTLTDIFATLGTQNKNALGGVLFEESLMPWKSIISDALSPDKQTTSVSYILSTGNELSPVHWCGLFLDKETKIAYCYNSLGLGMKKRDVLQKILGTEWRFCVNTVDQQTKSSLCGIYAIKFIKYMLCLESGQREESFKLAFDDAADEKKGDVAMRDEMGNYINPIKEWNPLNVGVGRR